MREKIKHFFKQLFMKKHPKVQDEFQFNVLIIDDEANDIRLALGMTDKRCKELQVIISSTFSKHKDVISAAVEASKTCKHANELFYVSYFMGRKMEQNESKGGLLKALLG